jgi:hypothetical protein
MPNAVDHCTLTVQVEKGLKPPFKGFLKMVDPKITIYHGHPWSSMTWMI